MMKPINTGVTRILNTAASLLLFLLFIICTLFIIKSAAGTYGRINDGYEETYGSAASARYISNKMRAADSCEIIDSSTVALTSGGLLTVIYINDGGLYEKYLAAGSDIVADGGDMIFELDSMNITENERLYSIEITVGGSSSEILLRKG